MARTIRSLSFVLFMLLMIVPVGSVHAQTPQQTLTQYLSDLQKNPNDYTLRERIIKHVQTMRPAPAIPEEAKKRLNRGMAAAESAKAENDYKDAIEEFRKAVTIAPWLGIGYRNLAVIQDKAGQYAQALQNLKLFLLTNPPAADAEAAKTLMDKIEYRQEKAAKESSPQAIAAKKQNEYETWLKKINGARYKYHVSTNRDAGDWILDIHGNQVVKGLIITWSKFSPEDTGVYQKDASTTLDGREFALDSNGKLFCSDFKTRAVEKGRISDDGNSITTNVCNETRIYRRER